MGVGRIGMAFQSLGRPGDDLTTPGKSKFSLFARSTVSIRCRIPKVVTLRFLALLGRR